MGDDSGYSPAAALDDRALVERLDSQGLLGRIEALPDQCAEAWRAASELKLPEGYSDVRELVILGMGGSAMAGDILRALAVLTGRKQVSVSRGYDVPKFVTSETLVVACSHSGGTEETLSAFEHARSAGARLLVLTTGGRLLELAEEQGVPAFVYKYDGEPRAALGHQLMALLAVGERVQALPPQEAAVEEAVALMREAHGRLGFATPAGDNSAKQLAARLHERLPVVVGAGILREAAYRWKTQLNENSECWALTEELPELNHNSVVGFGLPRDVVGRMHVVFLWNEALHPRLLLRYEATAAALTEAGVSHERVEVRGSGPLAQALSAIYFGDLASYYLGLLNGVEPSSVAAIDRLKARLEER